MSKNIVNETYTITGVYQNIIVVVSLYQDFT